MRRGPSRTKGPSRRGKMRPTMKITALDGYCLNPGDLSWDPIRRHGDIAVFDRTSPGEVLQRAAGAEIVLVNKTRLPGEVLRQLPSLRYIGVLATGYDIV